MYTIVMDKYKNLVTTVRAVLYKGEHMVDKIQFLCPPQYGGNAGRIVVDEETGEETLVQDGIIDLADYTATLKYTDPNGNFHAEVLARDDEKYKNYYRYCLPVDTQFSQTAGKITVRLTFTYFDPITEKLEKLESNSTTINIDKPQGFDDYVNWEDIEAYKAQITKLTGEVEELQNTMPDDLAVDDKDVLHLTHNDEPMGNGVEILVPGTSDPDGKKDGVIEVDEVPDDAEAYEDNNLIFIEA